MRLAAVSSPADPSKAGVGSSGSERGGFALVPFLNWIRISVALGDDPKVHRLAEALGCRVAEAAGLLVLLLSRFPEHAPDGNLAQIPASLVERWATWDGDRNAFDSAFRSIFLTDAGVWAAWDKHNGRALTKLERDRERLRLQRETAQEATLAGLSRDGRSDGRQPVAGTDGRTDEVQLRGRSRAKANGTSGPHYEPAQPVSPKFCDHCDGEPITNDKGRITGMRHTETCRG